MPARLGGPVERWGAVVDGNPEVGDVLLIASRSGKSWRAVVTGVLQARTEDHYALVETRSIHSTIRNTVSDETRAEDRRAAFLRAAGPLPARR